MRHPAYPTYNRICLMILLAFVQIQALAQPPPAAVQAASTVFDSRFDARHDFQYSRIPIKYLLAEISKLTGIDLFADETLYDERVTVLCHQRPLSAILQQVARLCGYTWTKQGEGNAAAYLLKLSDVERQRLEKSRQTRTEANVERSIAEATTFEQFSLLPDAQRDELLGSLPLKLAAAKDPEERTKLLMHQSVLTDLSDNGSRGRWYRVVAKFLRSMTPQEIREMYRGHVTYFVWPKLEGCREFPASILKDLQQTGRREFGGSAGFTSEPSTVRLRFTAMKGKTPFLQWFIHIAQRNPNFTGTVGFAGTSPGNWALTLPHGSPTGEVGPPEGAIRTSLSKPLKFTLNSDNTKVSTVQYAFHLDDALKAMSAEVPIDVVADGLWSGRLAGFNSPGLPQSEVLDRICRMTDHVWNVENGFLMVRARLYEEERDSEPPASRIAQWAEQYGRGQFGLDEYADISDLPDAQLATLQEMSLRTEFPLSVSPLQSSRPHLILWGALDRSQRRKATSTGLSYKDLNTDQKRLFLLAVTDPYTRQQTASPVEQSELLQAKLLINMQETAYYGVKRSGGPSTWRVNRSESVDGIPITKAEALKRFQQLDESIKIEEVQAMLLAMAVFQYDGAAGPISSGYVALPSRWQPNVK